MGAKGSMPNMNETPRIRQLRVQSSAYGVVIPLLYGTQRLAGNIFWVGNFRGVQEQHSSGGKSGGRVTPNAYRYFASVMIGLCEGPAQRLVEATVGRGSDVGQDGQVNAVVARNPGVWRLKRIVFAQRAGFWKFGADPAVGFGTQGVQGQFLARGLVPQVLGDDPDEPDPSPNDAAIWDHLEEKTGAQLKYPGQALTYPGLAYVAAKSMSLDSNASVPNFNFPVEGLASWRSTYGTRLDGEDILDALPTDIATDLLTSLVHGVGWSALNLADWTSGRNSWARYCIANRIVLSPLYDSARPAAEMLTELGTLTHTAFVWSEGKLRAIPYGDEFVASPEGNYDPTPSVPDNPEGASIWPRYHLTSADFLVENPGDDPIRVKRTAPTDVYTRVSVEYLNRRNAYAVEVAEATDQAAVATQGGAVRSAPAEQCHAICREQLARDHAQRLLQRMASVRATYEFRLGWQYLLLDPMDVVTLTEASHGFTQWPVRITSIEESEGGTYEITAEDLPIGVAAIDRYPMQPGLPGGIDFNADPGFSNIGPLFEPLYPLVTEPELWVAASGHPDTWGGAQVYLAEDPDGPFVQVGTIQGRSTHGTLWGGMPLVADPDVTTTQRVRVFDGQELVSGSPGDAAQLRRLIMVGHGNAYELVSFSTATFVSVTGVSSFYDLTTYLARGAYGTAPMAHANGTPWVLCDGTLLRIPIPTRMIGQTLYLKVAPFNVYGGGQVGIEDVGTITHVVQGTFLLSPLPAVSGVHVTFLDGYAQLGWVAPTDPRAPLSFEVRSGDTWETGTPVGETRETRLLIRGAGTFHVKAWVEIETGLGRKRVYSETAESVLVSQPTDTVDFFRETEVAVAGWPGTVDPYPLAVWARTPQAYYRFQDPQRLQHDSAGGSTATYFDAVPGEHLLPVYNPRDTGGLFCAAAELVPRWAFQFDVALWPYFGQEGISIALLVRRSRTNVTGGEVLLDGSRGLGPTGARKFWRLVIEQDGRLSFDQGRSDVVWATSASVQMDDTAAHLIVVRYLPANPAAFPAQATKPQSGILQCVCDGALVLNVLVTDMAFQTPLYVGKVATVATARETVQGHIGELAWFRGLLGDDDIAALEAARTAPGGMGLVLDHEAGIVMLGGGTAFDSVAGHVDDQPTIDYLGGVSPGGYFVPDAGLAGQHFATRGQLRPYAELDVVPTTPWATFDDVPVVDETAWIDGGTPEDLTALVEYGPRRDTPTADQTLGFAEAFRPYQPGLIEGLGVRWRLFLGGRVPNATAQVSRLLLGCDVLPRTERASGVPVGAGLLGVVGSVAVQNSADVVTFDTTGAVEVGDDALLLVAYLAPSAAGVPPAPTISDTNGETWTLLVATANSGIQPNVAAYRATPVSTLGAGSTITIDTGQPPGYRTVAAQLLAMRNLDALDVTAAGTVGSGTTLSAGPTPALATNGELVVAAFAALGAGTDPYVPLQGVALPSVGLPPQAGSGTSAFPVALHGQIFAEQDTGAVVALGTLTPARSWAGLVVAFETDPGGTDLVFTRPFNVKPAVTVSIQDAQAGDTVRVFDVTTTGFSVEVLNAGNPVTRTIDWVATGD